MVDMVRKTHEAETMTKIRHSRFQACISFLRCFRKENLGKGWQFPISFYGRVSRFQVFQTKVAHFCSYLVRIKMPPTPLGGPFLGLVMSRSRERERRKTMAEKGKDKKEEETLKHEKKHLLGGYFRLYV